MRLKTKFYVSRQRYYYSGESAVEIAIGGLDYSGSDMLVSKYAGEGEEYNSPAEAAQAAIDICRQWRKDGVKSAFVTVINSHGFTVEGESMTFPEVQAWAKALEQSLPKCPICGDFLPDENQRYSLYDDFFEEEYCSEYCAEKAYQNAFELETEDY